jgi:hypothetical protein
MGRFSAARYFAIGIALIVFNSPAWAAEDGWERDPLSYAIGNFSGFSEVVNIGIKKMALSLALSSAEMDDLEREVIPIAQQRGVDIYREPEFLVTDLFPPTATEDKEVLIIYRGSTLDEYRALKDKKAALLAADEYEGEMRREIAWEMGKLLSYPDEKIRELLGED